MAKSINKPIEIDFAHIKRLYGAVLDLGPSVFGHNLTCKALRGFARLDYLAVASGPDVYDKFLNPGGTQRSLDSARTERIYEYALGEENGKPIMGSRAFPEVLLNVRDRLPIELYDLASGEQMSFTDVVTKPSGTVVGIRIHLDKLEFPKPDFEPRISRIDGDHRLSGMDHHLIDDEGNLTLADGMVPVVPFALFLDLTTPEERRIFNVVNSKRQNVEPALLETQRVDLMSDEERRSPENIASVIARRLADTGGAFEKMIFAGGDRVGAKKLGLKLVLKSSTLASTVKTQLASRKSVSGPLSKEPDELFLYVNNYWKAVRETFPQEWANREDYILLQTIGLGAFAKYWGEIIEKVIDQSAGRVEDFKPYLTSFQGIGFGRKDPKFKGVAGAGGVDTVFGILTNNRNEIAESLERARNKRKPKADWKDGLVADEPIDNDHLARHSGGRVFRPSFTVFLISVDWGEGRIHRRPCRGNS